MDREQRMDFEVFQDNVGILFRYRDQLAAKTSGVKDLRILDYGAGEVAQTAYLLSSVRRNGVTVVAYDPLLDSSRAVTRPEGGIELTTQEPDPQEFQVVTLGFMLHHLNRAPAEVIGDLAGRYSPRWVGLVEYDFTRASAEEFKETFASMAEQHEIRKQFGGDLEACWKYHKRLGEEDYRKALAPNGFQVVSNDRGRGFARNKFFLIGERR